jgi:predicted DNA repair protein MutK
MLWVGGQIILHGLNVHPAQFLGLTSGMTAWLADAALSGVCGLALGAVIVGVHHRFARQK